MTRQVDDAMCRMLVRTSVTRWRRLSSSHVARLPIAASSCKLFYTGDCSCACASLCARVPVQACVHFVSEFLDTLVAHSYVTNYQVK